MNEDDKNAIDSAADFLIEPPDTGEIRLNNWHDACIHIRALLKVIEAQQAEIERLKGERDELESELKNWNGENDTAIAPTMAKPITVRGRIVDSRISSELTEYEED